MLLWYCSPPGESIYKTFLEPLCIIIGNPLFSDYRIFRTITSGLPVNLPCITKGAGNLPVQVQVYNLWNSECVYAVSWHSVLQLLVVVLWANILWYFHIELNLFCDKNTGVWAIVRKIRYVLYSSLWEATHVSKHFIMWTWVKLTRQNVTI